MTFSISLVGQVLGKWKTSEKRFPDKIFDSSKQSTDLVFSIIIENKARRRSDVRAINSLARFRILSKDSQTKTFCLQVNTIYASDKYFFLTIFITKFLYATTFPSCKTLKNTVFGKKGLFARGPLPLSKACVKCDFGQNVPRGR